MVRNYTDEPVDPDTLERIVAAGLKAPSAGHSQGQSFVVVTDATLRSEIAVLADEPAYVAMGFDPWISRAPVHIVICVSEAVYRARYAEPDKGGPDQEQDWPVPYWWVDAGAAMMLVLLAAVDERLAAGFLGSHAMADLSDLLGIPEDVSPIGIVTLGHAAADRKSTSLDRGRRPRSDVVHHDGW
jgi:nitroreductase